MERFGAALPPHAFHSLSRERLGMRPRRRGDETERDQEGQQEKAHDPIYPVGARTGRQPPIVARIPNTPTASTSTSPGRANRSQRPSGTPAASSTAMSAPFVGVISSASPAPIW